MPILFCFHLLHAACWIGVFTFMCVGVCIFLGVDFFSKAPSPCIFVVFHVLRPDELFCCLTSALLPACVMVLVLDGSILCARACR